MKARFPGPGGAWSVGTSAAAAATLAATLLATSPVRASNQGGGGAFVVLGLLYAAPLLLLVAQLLLAIPLTFVQPRPPSAPRARTAAKVCLGLGTASLLLLMLGPLLIRESAFGVWGGLMAASALSGVFVAATHLAASPSGRPRRRARLAAWALPALVVLGMVLSVGATEAGERERDQHLRQRLSGHFLGTDAIAYLPGGALFAAGTDMGKPALHRWTAKGGSWSDEEIPFRGESEVYDADVHVASNQALVATFDGVWRLDLAAPDAATVLPESKGLIEAVAIGAAGGDGTWGAAAGAGDVVVWSLAGGGERRHRLQLFDKMVTALAFGARGETLIASGLDERIVVIDLKTGETRCTLTGPGASASALFAAPDGQTLLSGAQESSIRRWDLAACAAAEVFAAHGASATAFQLSPDGRTLAVGDARSQVHLYPFPGGGDEGPRWLGQVFIREDPYGLNGIAFIAFDPQRSELSAASSGNHDTIGVFRLPSETAAQGI